MIPIMLALDTATEENHARFPVYEESLDNIIGIIHLRDLVRAVHGGQDVQTPVRTLMRPPLLLPESASVEVVLTEMRRLRTQMAILIDEHGGTAGLVTMEDLMEVIVGEVQDEFEAPHEEFHTQPDGTILVDGLAPAKELEE